MAWYCSLFMKKTLFRKFPENWTWAQMMRFDVTLNGTKTLIISLFAEITPPPLRRGWFFFVSFFFYKTIGITKPWNMLKRVNQSLGVRIAYDAISPNKLFWGSKTGKMQHLRRWKFFCLQFRSSINPSFLQIRMQNLAPFMSKGQFFR